jgi:hypothetical protein
MVEQTGKMVWLQEEDEYGWVPGISNLNFS